MSPQVSDSTCHDKFPSVLHLMDGLPHNCRTNCRSQGSKVIHFMWIVQRLASFSRPTSMYFPPPEPWCLSPTSCKTPWWCFWGDNPGSIPKQGEQMAISISESLQSSGSKIFFAEPQSPGGVNVACSHLSWPSPSPVCLPFWYHLQKGLLSSWGLTSSSMTPSPFAGLWLGHSPFWFLHLGYVFQPTCRTSLSFLAPSGRWYIPPWDSFYQWRCSPPRMWGFSFFRWWP